MPVKGWIEVNEIYCKGCDLCVNVCPPSVISLDLDRLTPKGYHPAFLASNGCTGCAVCALVCPEAAITVFRELPPRKGKVEQETQKTSIIT